MHRIIAPLACALALGNAAAQSSALDHAVATYATVKSSRATFSQTLTNPLTGKTTVSKGEIVSHQPGQVAVKFTEPAGDRIVADGKSVWVYLPSTNPGQVIHSAAGTNSTGVPDVTAQFLESPKTRYTITDRGSASVNGRAVHAVGLVPKQPGMPFTKATIWIDDADGIVRQVETTDDNGLTRKVTFDEVTLNAKVDPSAFVFTVPKGAKVFDQ